MKLLNFKAYITKHEGSRLKVYLDSLGIPTIGVGFCLARAGARESITAVGADYDKILAGTLVLTLDQIDKLLNDDIKDCIDDLHKLFPNFDKMPQEAQSVLVDMRFQLGPARIRKFSNTMKAFQDGKWSDAANGIKTSAMYKQVPVRCDENITLLNSIK